MILIAPDKFKGTLTAKEAAEIIAKELKGHPCIVAPMADGGEGTAKAIASPRIQQWEEREGYFLHIPSRTAVIDSSAWIGLAQAAKMGGVMQATSAPLGAKVKELLDEECATIIIGIGGTGTCDGGAGFLSALDKENLPKYADRIIGLSDVKVPLISNGDAIDALSFAPQKGATSSDMPLLRQRLILARQEWGGGRTSPFDGAGGGLGFAIASAIGAPCYCGAEYVLNNYNIDWTKVDAVITGEGCIDRQTLAGKVVSAVCRKALEYGIPAIAIGGRLADDFDGEQIPTGITIISAEEFKDSSILTKEEAVGRLRRASIHAKSLLLDSLR
ncbi:MAG: glycerate kinase [Lachnospiraceae bacterium]|nr:glycerate kinase [Lachnospiraceae bacterium]